MADLSGLRDAGIPIDDYTPEEIAALEGLSQEEIDTLASIRAKLNEGGEEERAKRGDTGTIVW